MNIRDLFNKITGRDRQIILDTETTGLVDSRLVSIGLLEMVNGKVTKKKIYKVVNPEVAMEDVVIRIHGIDNETAAKEPTFDKYAKQIRKFIGNSPVVISCRTVDGYTLDISVLNMEMEKAGQPPIPVEQWLNVRRWGEEMFGNNGARLDAMLDHYGVSRAQRDAEGHGALLDAKLLAEVYPQLKKDYEAFVKAKLAKTLDENADRIANSVEAGQAELAEKGLKGVPSLDDIEKKRKKTPVKDRLARVLK